MNKTQACKLALEQTGRLYPIGGGWVYLTYDQRMSAWWENKYANYWQARGVRRRHLIAVANALMGREPDRYECGDYVGGKWQDWVRA